MKAWALTPQQCAQSRSKTCPLIKRFLFLLRSMIKGNILGDRNHRMVALKGDLKITWWVRPPRFADEKERKIKPQIPAKKKKSTIHVSRSCVPLPNKICSPMMCAWRKRNHSAHAKLTLLKFLHLGTGQCLPEGNPPFNSRGAAARPRQKGPRKGAEHRPIPPHLKDRLLGLSPSSSFSLRPLDLPGTPLSPPAPRANATNLRPQMQQHFSVADRVRLRRLRHRDSDGLVGGARRREAGRGLGWGGGAACGEGGVTCSQPLVGDARGQGAAESGGLPADLLPGEQLGAGWVRVRAGRKGRLGSWGRAGALAKPGTAGSWEGSDGARPLTDPLTCRWAWGEGLSRSLGSPTLLSRLPLFSSYNPRPKEHLPVPLARARWSRQDDENEEETVSSFKSEPFRRQRLAVTWEVE